MEFPTIAARNMTETLTDIEEFIQKFFFEAANDNQMKPNVYFNEWEIIQEEMASHLENTSGWSNQDIKEWSILLGRYFFQSLQVALSIISDEDVNWHYDILITQISYIIEFIRFDPQYPEGAKSNLTGSDLVDGWRQVLRYRIKCMRKYLKTGIYKDLDDCRSYDIIRDMGEHIDYPVEVSGYSEGRQGRQ